MKSFWSSNVRMPFVVAMLFGLALFSASFNSRAAPSGTVIALEGGELQLSAAQLATVCDQNPMDCNAVRIAGLENVCASFTKAFTGAGTTFTCVPRSGLMQAVHRTVAVDQPPMDLGWHLATNGQDQVIAKCGAEKTRVAIRKCWKTGNAAYVRALHEIRESRAGTAILPTTQGRGATEGPPARAR